MLYPETSPWGKVNYCAALSYDFFYVITNINSGYMFSEQVAKEKKLDWLFLSGRQFEDYYCFPSDSDAMLLVLLSKEFAWHIYRNYCIHSNVRMTFWDFFRFALNTVHSKFPLQEALFKDSLGTMKTWVKKSSRHFKYLWMHPKHPFASSGLALYLPEGWVDGTNNSDLEPSVVTEDGHFRITYSSIGIPYYLTLSMKHPLLDLVPGCLTASDYNLFKLMDKTEEFSARLAEGLHRYNALIGDTVPNKTLSKKYHKRIKERQPLDKFFDQLAKDFPKNHSHDFKQLVYNYLPEAVIYPDYVFSYLKSSDITSA